jgi:hypothetical protein
MAWVATAVSAVGAVGSAVGGISGANTSKRAGKNAKKQAKLAAAAALAESQKAQALNTQYYDQNRAEQTRIYDQNRADQARINEQNMAYMAPYRQAGLAGQNQLLTLMGLQGGNAGAADYGRYAKDFQMSDFQQDPGYAFRMSEGLKAMNAAAAARGGLMSGGALKAGQQYGQDMGSQEYQNAYNRYQTNRSNQLAPLGALTSAGMNAAQNTSATNALYGGQLGDASRAYAGQLGDASRGYANTQNEISMGGQQRASGYLTGGQQAQAAGNMGAQSAMNQGFSNAGSSMQNALLMNRLFPGEGGGGNPFSNIFKKPTTGGVIGATQPGFGQSLYS